MEVADRAKTAVRASEAFDGHSAFVALRENGRQTRAAQFFAFVFGR